MDLFQTERLLWREMKPDDLEALHEYARDPEVSQFMEWGPNSIEQTQEFLDRVLQQPSENPRLQYEGAVIVKSSGELIGAAGIHIVPEIRHLTPGN